MFRMYRKRPFQVVTFSINSPDEKDRVLAFLKEQRAITRNLQFNGNDAADAISAFGTDWSGAVPYTVLLAPACASFDMFRDYAERGRVFKREVQKLAAEFDGDGER